ncbi:MAG: ATP-binding cassette domain-containing protein [Pacificimonas sp.]|jgi:molybdate transport system ATP-binding protein|nr:ATP-binding cassette domain-containing protein [Pacificimonas sp.]
MFFDVDVTVARGERQVACAFRAENDLTVLTGPSGIGKSTLLQAMAGLLTPTRGHVVVNGRTLFGPGVDLPPEQRRCGYVFQDARLFPHMSVRDNLAFPRGTRFAVTELAERLGIADLLSRWPRSLSGGETRRVAIARALMADADFLLLDEPLVSLDAARARDIEALILKVRDEFVLPMLYVTHDLEEARRLGARVIRFEDVVVQY